MNRNESDYALHDSPANIIRVREVAGYNIRLKWTGTDYALTTDRITLYEDSGTTPLELDSGEERLAFWRPAAGRWEVVHGDVTILVAQATTAVTSGMATFTVWNIRVVHGVDPGVVPPAVLLVNNTLHLELEIDQWVYVIRNKDFTWDTWAGGGGGAEIVHFVLTEDLALDATEATADIDESSGATSGPITVFDSEVKFTGLIGYKGYAADIDGDWHILEMEGPARFADFTADATSDADTDEITATLTQMWGNPPNGRNPAVRYGLTVYKTNGSNCTIYEGDNFRAVWNEILEQWDLFWFDGLRITIVGTVYGEEDVDEDTESFTISSPALVTGWKLPAGPVTVYNDPPIVAAIGETVFARFNITRDADPDLCWDTGDGGNFLPKLKGIGSYDDSKVQVILQDADNDPEWTEAKEIDVITEITSLTISGGNLVLTYKKGTFKVVKEVTAPSSATVTIGVTEECPT